MKQLVERDRLAELTEAGLRWDPGGQASLTGPLLALADGIDLAFGLLARRWRATEERHPAALPATAMTGHLRSFPHQAVFAVALDPAEGNLDAFTRGPILNGDNGVALSRTAPVTAVLTPAACYHVYAAHRDETLTTARYVTTRNTCFRREPGYLPLQRQWSFSMREIICLGTPADADAFLTLARSLVSEFAELIDVPLDWTPATDPFFRPHTNPAYLLQRVQPTKFEATYPHGAGGLALGSINLHHDHFGRAFGITRDGAPATTACVAFGIERWLFAITDRHGPDPSGWPKLNELPGGPA